jgi:diguanylate cyclase (GGDEF)-like protein/PAS domain S-box-containing protein
MKAVLMPGRTITAGIWQLFAASLLLSLILVVSLYWELDRIAQDRAQGARSSAIQREVVTLREDLVDAETGQRGYLLTHDEHYLQPYTLAQGAVLRGLDDLLGQPLSEGERNYLTSLKPAIAAKMEELAQTVELGRRGQWDEVQKIVQEGRGVRAMDDIRRQFGAALAYERTVSDQRRAKITASLHQLTLMLVVGSAAIMALLLALTVRITRRLSTPILALVETIEAIAEGRLERRVSAIAHDEVGRIASAVNRLANHLKLARDDRESALRELQRGNEALQVSQAALLESESRMRMVIDNVPGLISYFDRDFKYRFVNRTYLDWFGVDPDSLIGMSLRDFYGQTNFDAITNTLHRVRDGETMTRERQIVGAGGRRDCQVTLVPHRGPDGEVIGIFSVHTDISERKKAEAALRASERFLSRSGEVAGVGGWEIDLVANVVNWSDQTCRLHDKEPGYHPTLEEAINFCTPEMQPVVNRAVEEAIRFGTPFDVELELVSATGRRFWARTVGASESEKGRTVRLVGAFQDITERRRMEQALNESHELMRVTLDSIGDAVITTDVQGRVEWLNPVAERMTGWKKDEAHGKVLDEVFVIIDEETRKPAPNPVPVCIEQRTTVGLADRTVLLRRGGGEYGIEDSAAPISDDSGRVLGAVIVFHDVSEQRRLSQEMRFRATHDALTGLANRAEFESRVDRLVEDLRADSGNHAVMFVDLDKFKQVNDACGHAVGDQLLCQMGVLLRELVRGRDTVARLGGDEFGLILEHCDLQHASLVAQKICDRVAEFRFLHDERSYRVGASVGLVPVDNRWSSGEALLQAADSACYAAKEAGRNCFRVWSETAAAAAAPRGDGQWGRRLEDAIERDCFELFAQRILPLEGADSGLRCEVLLRLPQADGPHILPGAFLPAAERFHLASRIDRWVIQRALGMIGAADGIDMIAINLSGQSIGDRAFHRDVMQLLAQARFGLHKLCFEVSEAAAITNLADARTFVEAVRASGVQVALDDFGAGATSFGYLKSLPVDFLKIDGQFIMGMPGEPLSQAAVRSFADVARVVNIRAVAECVENSEVLTALRNQGLPFAQGNFLHRPEPLAGLLAAR